MEYKIGDIVTFKKTHPCGSKQWEITRIGIDFKFKCQGCNRTIVMQRTEALKKIVKKVNANEKK